MRRGILSFETRTTEIFKMGEYYYKSGVSSLYGIGGILFDVSK